jgi:hypothetical protein
MALGTGRFVEGGDQNEIGLNHLLLWRGRGLPEILWRGISSCFLLRVCGLLEGGIVGSNLVPITITLARRSLLG